LRAACAANWKYSRGHSLLLAVWMKSAAAERDPRVVVRSVVAQEALGAELVRVGVELGRVVHEVDPRGDDRAGGEPVALDLGLLGEHPRDVCRDRPTPERLLDHGVEVRRAALVHLVEQPPEHLRVAEDPLERPRERTGGGLVAG